MHLRVAPAAAARTRRLCAAGLLVCCAGAGVAEASEGERAAARGPSRPAVAVRPRVALPTPSAVASPDRRLDVDVRARFARAPFSAGPSLGMVRFQHRALRDLEPQLQDLEVRRLAAPFGRTWADAGTPVPDHSEFVERAVRRATSRTVVRGLKDEVLGSWELRRRREAAARPSGSELAADEARRVRWKFGVSHGLPKLEARRALAGGTLRFGVEAHGFVRASIEQSSGAVADVGLDLDERRFVVNWRIPIGRRR
jgi:hypothetical protein